MKVTQRRAERTDDAGKAFASRLSPQGCYRPRRFVAGFSDREAEGARRRASRCLGKRSIPTRTVAARGTAASASPSGSRACRPISDLGARAAQSPANPTIERFCGKRTPWSRIAATKDRPSTSRSSSGSEGSARPAPVAPRISRRAGCSSRRCDPLAFCDRGRHSPAFCDALGSHGAVGRRALESRGVHGRPVWAARGARDQRHRGADQGVAELCGVDPSF